ncbi:hypothetical protein [uncultured Legionella sp.]|uniref:hypothetical protein n=1 Tax=uncultured Legionella sp. TaxID=210934 RepID=UPI00263A0CEA|nr:hypothetical protein [uncultured Legionella sp.]
MKQAKISVVPINIILTDLKNPVTATVTNTSSVDVYTQDSEVYKTTRAMIKGEHSNLKSVVISIITYNALVLSIT